MCIHLCIVLAQSLHPTVENETEVVLNELEQQSAMRSELDKRLSALEKQHGMIHTVNRYNGIGSLNYEILQDKY